MKERVAPAAGLGCLMEHWVEVMWARQSRRADVLRHCPEALGLQVSELEAELEGRAWILT